MEIIDRSDARAPSYHLQLTRWHARIGALVGPIAQLDRHGAPWAIKREGDYYAVFVPGEKDRDPVRAVGDENS